MRFSRFLRVRGYGFRRHVRPEAEPETPPPPPPPLPVNPYKVQVIYLVPTDKTDLGVTEIDNLMWHLREFYKRQLNNGKTFTFVPTVTYHSTHNADWFPTNPIGDPDQHFWFRRNTVADVQSFVGLTAWNDHHNDWLMYVDATPAYIDGVQQIAGGSIYTAVEWSKPLAALRGLDPDWTQCREIGGSGHELGHSFQLNHPPGPPDPNWGAAMMGVGYLTYPDCILTDEDKATCNASPFFSAVDPGVEPYPPGLCPFP